MNITSSQNWMTLRSENGKVYINDEEIPVPEWMNTGSQRMVNGEIYIGWYKYIESEKRFRKAWVVGVLEDAAKKLSNLFSKK